LISQLFLVDINQIELSNNGNILAFQIFRPCSTCMYLF